MRRKPSQIDHVRRVSPAHYQTQGIYGNFGRSLGRPDPDEVHPLDRVGLPGCIFSDGPRLPAICSLVCHYDGHGNVIVRFFDGKKELIEWSMTCTQADDVSLALKRASLMAHEHDQS